jgi:lipoprotein NlpD
LLTEPKAQRLPYSEANWAAVSGTTAAPATATSVTVQMPQAPAATVAISDGQNDWRWPAEGKLLGVFGQNGGKGIDIEGARNSPVLAAAPGKVVYSGAGLRGYGKMLIVKHSDEFLTAYAHNQALLVKEGDWVKGGQKIAEMGDTDSDRVKLHFEVRQFGKPLDPLNYLPEHK